jgi:hypothetical protein
MEFTIGLIQGSDAFFTSNRPWPLVKLRVDHDYLDLVCGFKTQRLKRDRVRRVSRYPGFTWFFAHGIRIEHDVEDVMPFLVLWAFEIKGIAVALEENGYAVCEAQEATGPRVDI